MRHLPPFFDYKNEITYSIKEHAKTVDEIKHPAIREAMKYLDMRELIVSYDADLPARSGLGTSSSFAVAMLTSFYAMKGKYVDRKRLAEEAIYLERVLCNESGGWQDQIAAAYGGLNKISFSDNEFNVSPVIISEERKRQLNENLMMFLTGFSRLSSTIQVEHEKAIISKDAQLSEIMSQVDAAQKILISGDLDDFGRLLHEAWILKRGINSAVSTDIIDHYYNLAKNAGALGGKLLGAGGGGFLLLYATKEKQQSVREKLSDLKEIPFKFENGGAKILYYAAEQYDLEENEV